MAPNFVLVSKRSSTYPRRGESCLGSSGWVDENQSASGLFSLAASLGKGAARRGWAGEKVDHFEQPGKE